MLGAAGPRSTAHCNRRFGEAAVDAKVFAAAFVDGYACLTDIAAAESFPVQAALHVASLLLANADWRATRAASRPIDQRIDRHDCRRALCHFAYRLGSRILHV